MCNYTRHLAEEVSALLDKLGLRLYDIQSDAAVATQYHIDKTPSLVIAAKDGDVDTDFGIRLAWVGEISRIMLEKYVTPLVENR